MLPDITFKVLSTSATSKLVYLFKRVFIRIGNKFLLYFFIALILAVLITFFYYKYISRLLKIDERKILNLLRNVFRPKFRKRRHKALADHDIFTRKQLKKMEERKKMLDIFAGKEIKKEGAGLKDVKDEGEDVDKDGYATWPPKPKKGVI